jgi:hypothetical protein
MMTQPWNINIVNINIQQNIADLFNNCFLTIADNITNNINNTTGNNTININNDTFMPFMSHIFTTKYRYVSSKPSTTEETENIIKVLK